VVLCNTDERQDKEAKYLKIALSEHMAGVILAPASNHTNLDAVVSRKTPVVAVDRSAHGYTVDAVLVDNAAGGRLGDPDPLPAEVFSCRLHHGPARRGDGPRTSGGLA